MPDSLVSLARGIADDVLFPAALAIDAADEVPTEQLQHLADNGFYAVSTTDDASSIPALIEALASGCLTTAFVWTQHLGAAAAAWHSSGAVHAELADRLASGELRAGVAFAHMLRPDPPMTIVEPTVDGWALSGVAPWVTGWGHIDLVHVAARHGDDVVWALVDAIEGPTLRSELIDLMAVRASQTVVLHCNDHPIPSGRVTSIQNFESWRANYALGLRTNGSFPLGVASRCCRLLGPTQFDDELNAARARLDAASAEQMPAARADAALLAVRAATALVVSTGGRAVTRSEHAQRLYREAMFLLVQGQTPQIRTHLLTKLTG